MDVYRSHAESNSQEPDNPRTERKKKRSQDMSGTARFCARGVGIFFLALVFFFPSSLRRKVACLKMFHLAFRPVVDSISCSVSPFPLHVTFFFFGCSHYGKVHRRNLAASCFAMKSKCALQQRQCDASQSRGWSWKGQRRRPTLRWVNVVFLTTPTRSVDPFPLKKKRWGRGCDSGGAPSGVPPFPPSKNTKKKKK